MIPDKDWLEEEQKRADEAFAKYPPEWCEKNRHGAIYNIPKSETGAVSKAITFYFGSKGQWWRNSPGKPGHMDVEFVHMTKVYPPPKEPWEWCGKSILFESSHKIRKIQEELASLYKVGDTVSFTYKGQRHTGIIVNKGQRATVVVPGSETKWYINYSSFEEE